MAKREQDEQGFGTQLPGTGGDFIDSQDVEGHGVRREEESAVRLDEESAKRDENDVEGHRMRSDDAETGLYSPGPTTQGEFVKRGPGDNPHGDR